MGASGCLDAVGGWGSKKPLPHWESLPQRPLALPLEAACLHTQLLSPSAARCSHHTHAYPFPLHLGSALAHPMSQQALGPASQASACLPCPSDFPNTFQGPTSTGQGGEGKKSQHLSAPTKCQARLRHIIITLEVSVYRPWEEGEAQ